MPTSDLFKINDLPKTIDFNGKKTLPFTDEIKEEELAKIFLNFYNRSLPIMSYIFNLYDYLETDDISFTPYLHGYKFIYKYIQNEDYVCNPQVVIDDFESAKALLEDAIVNVTLF